MYSRKTQGWLKHIDCILLDVLCLHMAFVLAYMTQHGFSSPYRSSPFLNLAMICTLVDFLLPIANRSMKDVLKRGYYKELAQTIRTKTVR